MRIITTDIYESSFLHCSGVKLAEVWLDQGKLNNTVVFAFEGNYHLEELQKSYHTGNAVVNLSDYRCSLNQLRDTMFETIEKQNKNSRLRRHNHNGTYTRRRNRTVKTRN